jgi:hypothetical protein
VLPGNGFQTAGFKDNLVQRDVVMIKNLLFAVALLSLALAGGCAKGGNGGGNGIVVKVSDGEVSQVGVNLSITFTAVVTGTSNTAVAWTLSGTACTGNPNPCGTIDGTTGVYQAPAAAPNPSSVTITATSRADSTARGTLPINIVPITVFVAPTPVNAGHGLVQQFTATAVPDNVPQKFTWAVSCSQGGTACGTLVQDTNVSGLAVYTAPASPPTGCTSGNCVQVTATSTIDTTGTGTAKVLVLSSRISGTYTLRFSGYDSAHHPTAIAGSLTFDKNGVFQQGMEDVVINTGAGSVPQHYTVNSATFTPVANNNNANNTNNAGTLTVDATTAGGPKNIYNAVLDAAGNLRVIESDGNWTGSGSVEQATPAKFANAASLTGVFVFGFTGTDLNGKRVGYVGLLPMDGAGNIGVTTPGQLDTNKGGTAATSTNVTGSYTMNNGVGTMTVTANDLPGTPTYGFNLYGISGQAKANDPLTLFAISTDLLATNPSVAGRLVFQDPGTKYDATALNAFAVSHLTGLDNTGSTTLVSLTSAAGNSSGNFSGIFDANDAGMIVAAQGFNCTYTTGTGGRYVVTMLGTGSSCTGGVPVVLYASGTNRGFLLDQSSAVMTGAMDPQQNNAFAPSQLPSTYAVATVSNATSGVVPMAATLLLTSLDSQTHKVAGTQYPGAQTVTGTYGLSNNGVGAITLTAPAANYVIYTLDATTLEIIDVDTTVKNAAVIFAQE